jgi:predicted lipoprotein with Yx(FWY)xxD motif
MRSRIPILAVLSTLILIASACGAQPAPAFVVSSTPVPGYGGTPMSTAAAIPATGGSSTAMPPSSSSGGAYGGGGGYGRGGASATQAPSSGGAAATQSVPGTGASGSAQIMVASNAKLGQILADGSGRTLYVLTSDTLNTSTCYAQCAQIWPPLLASSGSPSAASGIDAAQIGTALRTDGTTQVTYNGWPLYYFSNDKAPGDTNGQGIKNVWFVISPNGNPVK